MRFFISAVMSMSVAAIGLAEQPVTDVRNYAGYAHADCSAAKTAAVRIVLPAGAAPIPAGVPSSPPRPAIELLLSVGLDDALKQELTVARDAAAGTGTSAVGLSCPIVGDCSRAVSGKISLQRRADDGGLTGDFSILWPDEAARQSVVRGRFVAAWREAKSACR